MADFHIFNNVLIKYLGRDSKVTIPSGILKIGKFAFENDIYIEEVHIPNTVELIDEYAFANCGKLKSVTLPYFYVKINRAAFYNCRELEQVKKDFNEDELPAIIDRFNKSKKVFINDFPEINCLNDIYDTNDYFNLTNPIKKPSSNGEPSVFVDEDFGQLYQLEKENIHKLRITADEIQQNIDNLNGLLSNPNNFFNLDNDPAPDLDKDINPNNIAVIGKKRCNKNNCDQSLYFKNIKEIKDKSINDDIDFINDFEIDLIRKVTRITSLYKKQNQSYKGAPIMRILTIYDNIFRFDDLTTVDIGKHAFLGCYNLNMVDLPNLITDVDDFAFFDCRNLISIQGDFKFCSLSRGAFYGNKDLEIVRLCKYCNTNIQSFAGCNKVDCFGNLNLLHQYQF